MAQFLRDERSRAVELCKTTKIIVYGPAAAGIETTRRDIAAAIKGE